MTDLFAEDLCKFASVGSVNQDSVKITAWHPTAQYVVQCVGSDVLTNHKDRVVRKRLQDALKRVLPVAEAASDVPGGVLTAVSPKRLREAAAALAECASADSGPEILVLGMLEARLSVLEQEDLWVAVL